MTTQEFELPVSCPTCKAIRTVWSVERRYASDSGQEYATYKCGCRMECYLSHKRHDLLCDVGKHWTRRAPLAKRRAARSPH